MGPSVNTQDPPVFHLKVAGSLLLGCGTIASQSSSLDIATPCFFSEASDFFYSFRKLYNLSHGRRNRGGHRGQGRPSF